MASTHGIVNETGMTPAWLTDILRQHGFIRGEVRSIEMERIGVGSGFTSKLFRARPEVSDPLPEPLSIIVKTACDDPEARPFMAPYFAREARFYQELAPTAGMPTPRVFSASVDESTGDGLIVMEDLGHYDWPVPFTGCSLEQATLAVDRLAAFHARWWGDASAREVAWAPVFMDDPEVDGSLYRTAWERLTVRHSSALVASSLALGERLYMQFSAIYEAVLLDATRERLTLCQGDFRLGNIAFGASLLDASLCVIDWALIRRGRGTTDLAWFLYHLPTDLRRSCEVSLIERYHAALLAHGVADYSTEQLRADFRVSVIQIYHLMIMALGVVIMSTTPDLDEVVARIFDRFAALIGDYQGLDLVEVASAE